MIFKKNSELKTISREKMLGKYGTAIGAFLFMRAIMICATDICRYIANPTGIVLIAIIFILALIEGIFVYGEQGIYMRIASGAETKMNDMFMAFRGDADRAILARFLFMLMLYGPITVSYIVLMYCRHDMFMMLMAIAVTALLMILMVYLLLTYSQVLLIMQDFPQIGVIEAYKRSRKLMKGRKGALLYMYISFIPLHLIGLISFFAGEIFIHPYYKLSLTEFYFDSVRAQSMVQTPNVVRFDQMV